MYMTKSAFLKNKSASTKASYERSLKEFAEVNEIPDLETYIKGLQKDPEGVDIFFKHLTKYAEFINVPRTVKDKKGKIIKTIPWQENTISSRLTGIRSYAAINNLHIPKEFYNTLFDKKDYANDDYEGKPFSVDQARAVYAALSPLMKPLYITLYTSGMRVGEALKIKWKDDVHLDETPARIVLPAGITKTNKKRTVFISQEAAIVLREWIENLPKYRRMATKKSAGAKKIFGEVKPRSNELLFPMASTNFRHALNAATKELGFNNGGRRELKVHSLRKSFRQIVGTDAKQIDLAENLMGHQSELGKAYATIPEEKLPGLYLKIEPYLMLTDAGKTAVKIHDDEVSQLRAELASAMKKVALISEIYDKLTTGKYPDLNLKLNKGDIPELESSL